MKYYQIGRGEKKIRVLNAGELFIFRDKVVVCVNPGCNLFICQFCLVLAAWRGKKHSYIQSCAFILLECCTWIMWFIIIIKKKRNYPEIVHLVQISAFYIAEEVRNEV